MNSGISNNRANASNDYRDLYNYVYNFNNEDDEDLDTLLKRAIENPNIRSFGPHKIVKHVGVQTDLDVDENYVPWLLEAESKTENFYVELCNLINTLHHSRSIAPKIKTKVNPSRSSLSMKKFLSEKSCRTNINVNNVGHKMLPELGLEDNAPPLPLQLIEDRIHAILKSAMEFKNSFPKVGAEMSDGIIEQEYDVMNTKTVKETNFLQLERSKSSMLTGSLPQQVYKSKKSNSTLSTVSKSKFVEKRQTHCQFKNLIHGIRLSDKLYSIPKPKNLASAKNTATGISRPSRNAQAKQTNPPDEVPTKETGAIPKERRVTSANPIIRNPKDKKTKNKPLWR